MPKIITNASERQAHPLYPNKRSNKHHNMTAKEHGMTAEEHANMSDKTTAIPKTYDAIKSAAGADMKAKGKKY
jgi:hypothetical protein